MSYAKMCRTYYESKWPMWMLPEYNSIEEHVGLSSQCLSKHDQELVKLPRCHSKRNIRRVEHPIVPVHYFHVARIQLTKLGFPMWEGVLFNKITKFFV